MNLYGPKQLADSMRTVRKNTILIAEDIPEKDYSYRPTPESRSVAEILVHIASLALFDRLVHEEQHLSSLEGFDYGLRSRNRRHKKGFRVRKQRSLNASALKANVGAGGWSNFQTIFWRNRYGCLAASRKIALRCCSGPKNMKYITGHSSW